MAGVGGYRRRNGGGDERFYCPPAMRQRYNQQQQQLDNRSNSKAKSKSKSKDSSVESGKMIDCDDPTTSFSLENVTNLDRFLEHTTPTVTAQRFPKTSLRGWKSNDDEFHPYFSLGDLWESFGEWSAYGVGVPLVLNGNDSVIQYYVPYLSGIQLYIDPSKPFVEQKRNVDESDAESSRETSSDGSSEVVLNAGGNSIQGTQRISNPTSAAIQGFNNLSLRNNHFVGSSMDGGDFRNPPGLLVFEYLEQETPYGRKPLTDTISLLGSRFPELKTLRSCDLTPASWISVAWYPIYRIPIGQSLQNIDACFLTYHSLSTPLQNTSNEWPRHLHSSTICRGVHDNGMSIKLSLPIFGLASYKFKVSDWNSDGVQESQKVDSLLRAADNWLRLLQVNHHDYTFFVSRNLYWR